MAKYGSADAFALVDGYDLTGYTFDLSWAVEATTEETTVLGDTWVKNESVSLNKFSGDLNGFYDDAALASNAALVTMGGTSRVLCFGTAGVAVGRAFTGIAGAIQSKFHRAVSRGALHKIAANFIGNGIVEPDGLTHYYGTLTGTSGDGTAQDNAALSSAGGSGYAHTTALTLGGFTNLALKIRHSVDNITYADLATFAVVTAAPNAQRVTVAGTVNRYTRANWAYGGAGAGQSATVFLGFKRN